MFDPAGAKDNVRFSLEIETALRNRQWMSYKEDLFKRKTSDTIVNEA